jgi:four helix bundle protein
LKYAKGSAGELRSMISILYECELIGETQSKKVIQDVTFISQSIKNFMKYLVNHYQSTK